LVDLAVLGRVWIFCSNRWSQ